MSRSLFDIIIATDSYKVGHWLQYEPGTEAIFSFFESRGGVFPDITFFGLQYLLKGYFTGSVVTQEMIEEAAEDFALHFGDASYFNRAGWEYILRVHGGRLPIEICAVPEGTTVPTRNVLVTVTNTDPNCSWLVNYVEGALSHLWYSTTVATQSRMMKQVITRYLQETGTPGEGGGIAFKLHDFGYRGVSSNETAAIGGAAHLVSFMGTDTLPALRLLRHYYGERMAGFSVAAAEHSTVTMWGREREGEAYAHLVETFPTGILSVVADSYDVFHACRAHFGGKLKESILERDGVFVVRPDSGHPPTVVVQVLEALEEGFGSSTNEKGYKVLPDKVRVIQGDGIDRDMLGSILEAMKTKGWSADNIVFGSGGGLLQKLNRDTCKFAFKCSGAKVNGVWRDVMKDPITDPGKVSKAGRLALVRDEDGYKTIRLESLAGRNNVLRPVFRNGELLVDDSFTDIRARASL